MKKFTLLLLAVSLLSASHPVQAQQQNFFHALLRNESTLRAGPGSNYERIATINPNRYFELYGCLQNWSWCDVGSGNLRGWLPANEVYITEKTTAAVDGARAGVPMIAFVQKDYWYVYYRDMPFYNDWLHSNVKRPYDYRSGGYYPYPYYPRPPKPYPQQPVLPPIEQKPEPVLSPLEQRAQDMQNKIRANLER